VLNHPGRRRADGARPALLLALLGAAVSASPAGAQTREAPISSSSQFVAARSGSQTFLVDEGVNKVWLDVRQAQAGDAYTLTAPDGRALAAATGLERVQAKTDLNGVDPLGLFSEASAFRPRAPGEYSIDSAQAYVGIVMLEGGARMRFWVELLGADRLLRPGRDHELVVALEDGAGQPLADATVTIVVEQTLRTDGSRPETPVKTTLTLAPRDERGRYGATLAGGLEPGVYTFSVEGKKELVKRQLVTSLAVFEPGSATPTVKPSVPLRSVVIRDLAQESSRVKGSSGPGTVYYYPEDRADLNKPVIVFVHGFNAGPDTWYGDNGFTHPAIEANYRVAVVELHGDESFSTNAGLLTSAFPAIAAYYDVRKLVVVSHSKGGVDTDAALLFGGMTDRVKSVITLATPHWGSPLADLADSDWVWWLGEIFGVRDDAQASMKPAAMAQYRAQAASHPRNNFTYLDFRTISGWDFQAEALTYYQLSGLYLKQHGGGSGNGGNDGVVNYKDSRRPVGTEIFGGEPDGRTSVNHRQIHFRNQYWHHIQAQLLTVNYDNSPSAPAGLAGALVSTPAPGSIHLTWSYQSRNESGFRLERAVDGGPFAATSYVVPPGFQQMWDTQVEPGHTYAYRLRAHVSDLWFSDYSNTATVVFPQTLPLAPSGLTATALSATSVRLTWIDNSANESQFEIQRRPPSGSFVGLVTVPANTTSYTDTTVAPRSTYEYRLRAQNAAGSSAFTGIVSVTTPLAALGAPTGLSASFNAATRRFTLAWTDNSSNEQGFHLQFSYSGSAFSDLSPATVGTNVTTYTSGPNPPSGSYQFRVRAFSASHYSAFSDVAGLIVTAAPTNGPGYQGCYTDSPTRALPAQLGGTTHTVESCKQAAYNAGYRYAGLQYYGYCFGGNTLGYTLVPDNECNTPCTSNPGQICGGPWRNSIYATGYVPPNPAATRIAWIQPAESSWGPPGTLTAAGYATNGSGGVQLVWRERSSTGVWGPWTTVAWQPPPSPDTTWSNTISSGNPTNRCHWFDAYTNYSGATSPVFHYTGAPGCP
jgi:pimeloyl-ACP methyl ester carboxylesterase